MTALTHNLTPLPRSLDGPGLIGPSTSSKLSGWVALLAAALAILVFMFVLAPKGLEFQAMQSMVQSIDAHNIKSNAYYYTEVDQFLEAQTFMMDNREFGPARE